MPALGNFTVSEDSVLDFLQDSSQSSEDCGILNPVKGMLHLAKCDSLSGVVCQFWKGSNQ